jgi:predicted transcriptional regulator
MTEEQRQFSRREREIMDIIYRAGRATAMEVMQAMPDPPSYSAVRAMLGVLERRGHLKHEHDGNRYVYVPTVAREKASLSALRHLLHTFFDGSPERVVAALLEDPRTDLSEDDLDRLSALIEQAKKEGR